MKEFSRVQSHNNQNQPVPSFSSQQNFLLLSQQFSQFNLKKINKDNSRPQQNVLKTYSNNPLLNNIKSQLNGLKDEMNKLFKKQSQQNGIQNMKNSFISPKNFMSSRALAQNRQYQKPISIVMNRQPLKIPKNNEPKSIRQPFIKTTENTSQISKFNSHILTARANKHTGPSQFRFCSFFPKEKRIQTRANKQENNNGKYQFYTGVDKSRLQCQNLKRENQWLKKTLESKSIEILTINCQLSQLKAQKWGKQLENIELKKSLEDSLQKIAILKRELVNYQAKGKEYQIQKGILLRDLDYIKTELSKSSYKNSEILTEREKFSKRIQTLQSQLERKIIQKYNQSKKNEELERQIKEKKKFLKQKQQLCNKLSQEISFLRQDIHFIEDNKILCDHLSQTNYTLNEQIMVLNIKGLNKKYQTSSLD